MKKLILKFPEQIKEGVAIASAFKWKVQQSVSNVVISGLGGSGIGGEIVKELVANELPVPLSVTRDYSLPHYVDKDSLVIISSYSGNTEETVSAFEDALHKEAQIACITSNGQVLQIAQAHNLPVIQIPGGDPPRACVGYSVVAQLFLLEKFNLITSKEQEILNAAQFLEQEQSSIQQRAKEIAAKISDQLPVLYVVNNHESIAIRARQQFNENAKKLAWHHVLPEMNHNEIVGWHDSQPEIAALFLRFPGEHERKQLRIEFTKNKVREKAGVVEEVVAKGNTMVEQYFYMIHLVDWLSFYMAENRKVDAMDIAVIDELKERLSN